MRQIPIGLAVIASVFIAQSSMACDASDFEVKGLKWSQSDGRFDIIFVLVNNCDQAAGAEVQVVAFDADGSPVAETQGWPKSASNLAPGEGFVTSIFSTLLDWRPGVEGIGVNVIRAKTWRRR